MASAFRIHRSDEVRVARSGQADVGRAMEVFGAEAGAEEARIQGGIQEIRRRLDTVLDDLLPPAARPGLAEWLLHWAGLGLRARAADAALATLLHEIPPGTRHVAICVGASVRASGERVTPGQVMREHVAAALDDAYCVLLPHEAARRAELHRAFWASAREEGRKREFIARCLGRSGQEAQVGRGSIGGAGSGHRGGGG